MKLYVGNLSFDMTDSSLGEVFSAFGTVDSAKVIVDRDTGRSKGFGFVEMSNKAEADEAIKQLNGKEVEGRAIRVDFAKEKEAPRRFQA